ncbi:uncharacterized protein LOC124291924 isoform X2 [Haliotis rubra]|uniref:uncharacterized protein LOC124291924 isoform X2 n=1 Tax=Haliotis rubra TaxID=36100 RepID=UPI001EE61798|nr:uncharacterized protein LOC124291924 isoform X2 [Haliotis rubra]
MDEMGTPGGYCGSSNTSPAASNNVQSLALFEKLQHQIPGFENIPSPKGLSQQKSSDQRIKEPLKGVSRSNLFVQCINRGGVEKGLQTDEQASHTAQSVLGNQQLEGKVYTYEHTGYPSPALSNTAPSQQNGTSFNSYLQSEQTQQAYGYPVNHQAYVTYPHPHSYMSRRYGTPGVGQDVNAKDIQNQPKGNQPFQYGWQFDNVDRDVRQDGKRGYDRVKGSTGRGINRNSYNDRDVNRGTHLGRNNDRGRDRRSDMERGLGRNANRRTDTDRRREHSFDGERGSSAGQRRSPVRERHSAGKKSSTSGEITKERSEGQPEERKMFTRARETPSLENLKKKKSEYESRLQKLQDEINSFDQNSETQDSNSKSSVFKRPLAPPPVAKSTSGFSDASGPPSEKQRKFSKDFTAVAPPVFQDVKPNKKSKREGMDPDVVKTTSAEATSTCDAEKALIAEASASAKPNNNSWVRGPRQPCQGGTVSDFIANFITMVCKSKDGVQIVAGKYKLPGNCIGLLPPRMIQDVWSILKKPTQTRDEMLQDVERWLALSVIPIVVLISMFGKGPQPLKDTRRMTSDALTVLGYVCRSMSIKRRLLMRSALNKKYALLCRTSNCMSDYIFGDNVANDLVEIKLGTYNVPKSNEEDNDDIFALNYKMKFCAALALIGPDADVNVAGMVNMACANDGAVEDLREKYPIPSNCNCLLPSKINPEIWSLLSPSGLNIDHRLQDVHLCIAEGMIPLMKLLQSVHDKKYDPNVALSSLTDALTLLGNSIFQLNKVRMDLMMKTLPEEAHGFCRWYWAGAEEVFGDRLEEELQVRDKSDKSKMAEVMLEIVKSQNTKHSSVSGSSSTGILRR